MKKISTKKFVAFIVCVFTVTMIANAQKGGYQLANGNFEGTWTDNTRNKYKESTPDNWNSFFTAKTNSTTEMAFGTIITGAQAGTLAKASGDDAHAGFAAKITSVKNMMKSISNGNLTTGRINMGDTNPSAASNYNFTDLNDETCNHSFIGYPDSMVFWVKFTPVTKTNFGQAHLIIHDEFEYKEPNETEENVAAHRIGYARTEIAETNGIWVRISEPFVYNTEKMNITGNRYMLASFTTNKEAGKGDGGDVLCIDDIEMIYNSHLVSLSIDGIPVDGFTSDRCDDPSDPIVITGEKPTDLNASIEAISDGQAATVSLGEENGLVAVTVKGNDYVEGTNENKHVYYLKFESVPEVVPVEDIVGIYNGLLDVDMTAMSSSSEEFIVTTPDQISLSKGAVTNTVNLLLKNFSFMGMELGDINLEDIPVTVEGNIMKFESTVVPMTWNVGGFMTINADVKGIGSVENGVLTADIDVQWKTDEGVTPIPVSFNGNIVSQGARLSDILYNGTSIFVVDKFNYNITPGIDKEISFTKANTDAKVDVVMDGNWVTVTVTEGDQQNVYHLVNPDLNIPGIKAIKLGQSVIDGNLTISGGVEVAGNTKVAGKISYTKAVDGVWNVIGLPFIPAEVNTVLADGTKTAADAQWYSYTTQGGAYKPVELQSISDKGIMRLNTALDAVSLELVSSENSSIVGAAQTAGEGYTVIANTGLISVKPSDLVSADTYYVFDLENQVFVKATEASKVLPAAMFIAYKGSEPVETIAVPSDYDSLESHVSDSFEVYSFGGQIYVKNYEGTIGIYRLNGSKVSDMKISGDTEFGIANGTYVIHTGKTATIVVVR